jgi:hypothetical protein
LWKETAGYGKFFPVIARIAGRIASCSLVVFQRILGGDVFGYRFDGSDHPHSAG